jgi:hypothetical protein
MIRFAVKLVVGGVFGGALLYGLFFVPFGRRTLYEHLGRIAATEEAKELGADVEAKASRLSEGVRARLAADAIAGE